ASGGFGEIRQRSGFGVCESDTDPGGWNHVSLDHYSTRLSRPATGIVSGQQPMNTSTAIEIRGLRKSFGTLNVLNGIDFSVNHKQLVCIIGKSGSGKSTLLRCINMLETPTDGQVFVDGIQLTDPDVDIDKARQHIGMVFQQFNLFPHLTVVRNV